jgi:hypothetical protein
VKAFIQRLVLILSAAAGTFLVPASGTAALGETLFPPPEIRGTWDVGSPTLLRGPHYQLSSTVRTFAFLNQFSVTPDFGTFTPSSDVRLRRLIREIAAIAELQMIDQSDAFAKAAVEAGKGVVKGAQRLIEDPVATIGAVPDAVLGIFGRVSEATKPSGRSKHEDKVAENLLAVSSFKREYAKKLNIDVYSTTNCFKKSLTA